MSCKWPSSVAGVCSAAWHRAMWAAGVGPFGVEGRGAGDAYDCGFVARGRGDRSVPISDSKDSVCIVTEVLLDSTMREFTRFQIH